MSKESIKSGGPQGKKELFEPVLAKPTGELFLFSRILCVTQCSLDGAEAGI